MKFLKYLGSLKMTLVVFFILAVLSVAGTFIAQRREACFYTAVYGQTAGRFLLCLGADDLYNGYLYCGTLFFLGINLFLCMLRSVSPRLLKERKKAALFLVHCGVLVIFFGAFISKIMRYESYHRLFPGEFITLPRSGDRVVLNDFAIEYYRGTSLPCEYCSRVCLPESGGPVKEYDIRVNRPLVYKGYSFYQSGFEISAEVEIKMIHNRRVIWEGKWQPGDCLGIPGNNGLRVEFARFLPDVYEDEKGIRQVRMDAPRNPAIEINIYDRGRLVRQQVIFCDAQKNGRKAGEEVLFEWQIKNFTARCASILQVVKDPAAAIVWAGCLMVFSGLGVLVFKRQL